MLAAMSDNQTEASRWIIEQDVGDLRSVMQQLYESEINFEITARSFWGLSFVVVKLGDPVNGYKAEATWRTWAAVELWLIEQAIVHYPESAFARAHGGAANVLPEERKDPDTTEQADGVK
jgi:hypothetical protein